MNRRRAILLVVLMWVTWPALPARAAPSTAQLYEQGRNAVLHKDWKRAHELLTRVWAVRRSYDTAALLGQCELKLRDYRDAAQHLDYSLRNFPNSDPTADARERIRKGLAEARSKVATATIETDQAGAAIAVDGKAYGRAPLDGPVYLEPGHHVIEARLAGHAAAKRAISASAGQEMKVALSLPAAAHHAAVPARAGSAVPDGTEPPPDDATDRGPSARTWLLVGGSVLTAAGLAVGIGYTLRANAAQSDIDAAKPRAAGTCATASSASVCRDLAGAIDRRDHSRNIALGGFIGAGVAGVATLGGLLLTHRRPDKSAWLLAPAVHPHTAGVRVMGRF